MQPAKNPLPIPYQTPVAQDGYLTVHQAANQLGVSTKHIGNLVESGALEAINIGLGKSRKRYRLSRSGINDFKNRNAVSL